MSESLTWTAAEYEYRPKTANWYTVLFVLAAGISATAFILENFLFGIFVVIAAFSIALMANKRPLSRDFAITQRGLSISKTFIPWSALDAFWVDDQRAQPHLLIRRRDLLAPLIIIPLADISPDAIRERLLYKLEEEELAEPLSHRISEALGI